MELTISVIFSSVLIILGAILIYAFAVKQKIFKGKGESINSLDSELRQKVELNKELAHDQKYKLARQLVKNHYKKDFTLEELAIRKVYLESVEPIYFNSVLGIAYAVFSALVAFQISNSFKLESVFYQCFSFAICIIFLLSTYLFIPKWFIRSKKKPDNFLTKDFELKIIKKLLKKKLKK